MSREPAIRVRNVSDAELSAWGEVTATTVESGSGYSAAEIAAVLGRASPHTRQISFLAWLVEPGGEERAVARLRLSVQGERAEAWGLGLLPELAARGLEGGLLRGIEARAREAGARRLVVLSPAGHVELLERVGYRPTKVRVEMAADLLRRSVSCDRPLRTLAPDDEVERQALARLYWEAYAGTIDSDGETLADAVEEIRRTFAGDYGELLAGCTYLIEGDRPAQEDAGLPELGGAALVTTQGSDEALLAEVIVHPRYRGQGYARPLIQSAMNACLETGRRRMWLVVTRNNVPAEGLYRRMGFEEVPGSQEHHMERDL